MIEFTIKNDEFFDTLAVVAGQCVKACVYPPERADPLADAASDAAAIVTTILVRRVGEMAWNNLSVPPKTGDTVKLGERTYSVISVDLFCDDYYTIKAKSV